MPHAQRKRSETGFYHIVSKGDGGQVIFEEREDRFRFLEELETSASEHGIEIHAYCLMSNHVHLLVRDRESMLSEFMKQLNENYARYYARNTGRVGHVFQGRFWSEPVECDEHFLAALRYIHANPEPPGICKAKEYPWSSYRAYVGSKSFVITELALSLLGSVSRFCEFHEESRLSAKPFAGSTLTNHLSYDELSAIAVSIIGRETLNGLRMMTPKCRAPYLLKLHDAGMTRGEIARVTGLGPRSVERTLKS